MLSAIKKGGSGKLQYVSGAYGDVNTAAEVTLDLGSAKMVRVVTATNSQRSNNSQSITVTVSMGVSNATEVTLGTFSVGNNSSGWRIYLPDQTARYVRVHANSATWNAAGITVGYE